MIAFVDQGQLRLMPSDEEESLLLDRYANQVPHISGIQRTMEGDLTSITLTFTNG